jgi:hypothetical protein
MIPTMNGTAMNDTIMKDTTMNDTIMNQSRRVQPGASHGSIIVDATSSPILAIQAPKLFGALSDP